MDGKQMAAAFRLGLWAAGAIEGGHTKEQQFLLQGRSLQFLQTIATGEATTYDSPSELGGMELIQTDRDNRQQEREIADAILTHIQG